ncbi:MAG: hybrid sensor histidine kinase/response regulator [Ilumatobacteraceae bacterium]
MCPTQKVSRMEGSPTPDIGTAAAALLAALPYAVIAVGPAGRITYANQRVEVTFGYRADELVGLPLSILLPERLQPGHGGHVRGFFSHPMARPIGIGMDLAGRHRDGHEFPVEISLTPVDTGADLHVFATIVDITARKVIEAQLLQAQKLESVGRLAGGIAHDFNNILFAIAGYSELLEVDLATGGVGPITEQALESVRAIAASAKRGANLTGQLLSFSRQQVVSARVIEVDDAVRMLEPMLKPLIGERISLVPRLKAAGLRVKIDPGQFDQVVVNLVVNARDAMPSGGTIVIETGDMEFDDPLADGYVEIDPGRYAMVAVSDTGVGMGEETRRHAFEPFFTTKAAGKGTGLGLATSHGIIRQAGGNILLYSEPGRGSVFKVYLPVADAPEEAAQAQPEPLPSFASGAALVVEDEPAVRDVTTRLLERSGLEVVAVSDGTEALAVARRRHFDVLVTDAVMPGMSGIELADRLYEQDQGVGIVILSGYTAEALRPERAISRGAQFVGKPVNSHVLLAAIAASVAAAKARPETE